MDALRDDEWETLAAHLRVEPASAEGKSARGATEAMLACFEAEKGQERRLRPATVAGEFRTIADAARQLDEGLGRIAAGPGGNPYLNSSILGPERDIQTLMEFGEKVGRVADFLPEIARVFHHAATWTAKHESRGGPSTSPTVKLLAIRLGIVFEDNAAGTTKRNGRRLEFITEGLRVAGVTPRNGESLDARRVERYIKGALPFFEQARTRRKNRDK